MQLDKIRVYELVDVNEILKNEQLIKDVFFELLKVPKTSSGHQFSISPLSGWITYANNNELYSAIRKKTLLPNEDVDAEKIVKKFIKKINETFANNQPYKKTNLPLIFPPSLYHIENSLIFQQEDFPNANHWLVRFGIKLNDGKQQADVFGAALDIRIGNDYNKDFSQIIGFSLRWTPFKRSFEDEKIEFKQTHESHTQEHNVDKEPIIVYKLDGVSMPQNFLTPFYVSPNGDHLEFTPASNKYSLTARIFEINNDNGKDLFPDIKGGSGNFIYEWAFWQQGEFKSRITIVDANSISLPIGVFNVILNVIDRNTTVVIQTQSTVYVLGKEENRFQPTFEPFIKGCMHPLATNYMPTANVDDAEHPCMFPLP